MMRARRMMGGGTDSPTARDRQEQIVAEPNAMWWRRLRFALKLRMWPWQVPANVVKYVALDQRFTAAELTRINEIVAKYPRWDVNK